MGSICNSMRSINDNSFTLSKFGLSGRSIGYCYFLFSLFTTMEYSFTCQDLLQVKNFTICQIIRHFDNILIIAIIESYSSLYLCCLKRSKGCLIIFMWIIKSHIITSYIYIYIKQLAITLRRNIIYI